MFSAKASGRKESYIWRDGVRKSTNSVTTPGSADPIESGSVTALGLVEMEAGSPWLYTLNYIMHSPHPRICDYIVDRKISTAHKKVQIGGANLIQLDCLEKKQTRYTFLFDPARNYLPIKMTAFMLPGNSSYRMDYEVTASREVSPGIWFATTVEQSVVKKDKLDSSFRVEFESIKINEPIEAKSLEFAFPNNLYIIDKTTGESYTIGPDQQPLPKTVKAIPLSKDEQDAMVAARPWYGRWRVWLWVGCFVAIAAIVFVVYRRVRHRRISSV